MGLEFLLRKFILPSILLLSGCNDIGKSDTGSQDLSPVRIETSGAPSAINSFSLIDPWTGDLDGMEKRRIIRILTVYGPGRFYLDGAVGRGIVAEMSNRFEEHLNKKLGRGHVKIQVVNIPVARDQLIPALLSGYGDLISADLTKTNERLELVDFSMAASKPVSEVLITGPSAPKIKDIEDLSGEILYIRGSSSYFDSVVSLNQRLAEAKKPPASIELVSELLEDDDLIEMVNGGLLPWAIVDDYKPLLLKGVFQDIQVRKDIVFRERGSLAWAMRKNSPLLQKLVNEFLVKNREGTLIGNILHNRYIRDFDYAGNALKNEDYRRFKEVVDLFRHYGQKYGVDYLLAAAQGYQESRLNQSMRSPAGAIGIMQLLPSTAKDPNVGIEEIFEVEANIHAGIKYLHFIRNRYFSNSEIAPLDQTFFALAAYNAGPARVRDLRKKAKKAGYDPNVWFDNVELIAAQEIGRETVQYVANIYKYHLTYQLVANQQLKHRSARVEAGL